jgi:predicted acyltransferase
MANDPSSNATTAGKADRLLSLDVMRGLTILAMILVNNPGDWGAMYWPLAHADWHGWTPTDLIFPFFLFMVGVAMAYSFAKYTDGAGSPTRAVWLRILRRTLVLILLGLALNASGRLLGVPFGFQENWNWDNLRWPGVLQRIALGYFGASLIVLLLGHRGRWIAAIALLVGYTVLLKALPTDVPFAQRLEPESNVVLRVDEATIGRQHMWSGAVTDPEGLLSTLPAIVTPLIGYAVGRRLKSQPLTPGGAGKLLIAGLAIAAVGQGWHELWRSGSAPLLGLPINKALWTPSFVLLAGGLGMAMLACCLFVFDLAGKNSPALKRVATAFQMVGVNAIFVFVASGFVARAMSMFKIGGDTVKGWIESHLITGPLNAIGLNDPKLASLAYAVWFVACWWVVLWVMWRRGWSIRV